MARRVGAPSLSHTLPLSAWKKLFAPLIIIWSSFSDYRFFQDAMPSPRRPQSPHPANMTPSSFLEERLDRHARTPPTGAMIAAASAAIAFA